MKGASASRRCAAETKEGLVKGGSEVSDEDRKTDRGSFVGRVVVDTKRAEGVTAVPARQVGY